MPLVDPLPAEHSAEVAQVARFFESTLGFPPNSVLTMQRRPDIAKAFTHLNRAVMDNGGRVTGEQKRLIGHLASANAGCRYCEAHTVLAARRFGASDERLAALWSFRDSALFTAAEKAAFEFALAASSVPNAVDAAIGGELRRYWTDDEIVEILAVIACSDSSTAGTTRWPRRSRHRPQLRHPTTWSAAAGRPANTARRDGHRPARGMAIARAGGSRQPSRGLAMNKGKTSGKPSARATRRKTQASAPWEKDNPKGAGEHRPLSPQRKAAARRRAQAAGRPYPNLIDNMQAAKAAKK